METTNPTHFQLYIQVTHYANIKFHLHVQNGGMMSD